MGDWFAKLMQRGHTSSRQSDGGSSKRPRATLATAARHPRYDAIVQMLRDREAQEKDAREKRQKGYRQTLEIDSAFESNASGVSSPIRLYKFRTKVPCAATPDAHALIDQLRKRFSGCTVTFPQITNGQQAVMVTGGAGVERKQIGWLEHSVQADPKLCNVRHQGLAVETDGNGMLVLRFRYPPTAVKICSEHDDAARVEFTELRPALDLRPVEKSSTPRLVWVTRPEVETMSAIQSRDFEAFYLRFKVEVQAGIWNSLSGLLSASPASLLHRSSYYTVVREPDATSRKIYEKTVDDSGCMVDIGADRTYDAAPATDILLLHLDGDILAEFADIYFTLQTLGSADAYLLKEEFFTVIRRFWSSSQSLTSRYGSDLAAVIRMAQRTLPMPTQAPLLKQDWTTLRQSLVDRYGESGRKAVDLVGQNVYRPRVGQQGWPFASFPVGEINVGLRLVYRREFSGERSEAVLDEVIDGPVETMRSAIDLDGSTNTVVRRLAVRSEMGVESDRPAEIQNVVLVAEKLPTPAEIDRSWVRRHDWILAKVLLDESFRGALDTIGQETRKPNASVDTQRDRLYEHFKTNILHYQRAIWQHEDPQQRSMRYKKSGKKLPLDWRFELESGGALTVDELGDRLAAANVDGQFAAYSTGRQADLDDVIVPEGPIGYYGNYAIYQMRPEFGNEDVFSMLHFFKSPYLEPKPETAAQSIQDPEQIIESADVPEATPDSSEDETDRDEVLERYELILEGGHEIELLSAHGYQDAEAELAILRSGGERSTSLVAGAGIGAASAGSGPVVVKDEEGIHRLLAGAHDPKATASIAAPADEQPRVAGVRQLKTAQVNECAILSPTDEAAPRLSVGSGHDRDDEQEIVAPIDTGGAPSLCAGNARDFGTALAIAAPADGKRTRIVLAGAGVATTKDPKAERVIAARGDGERTLTLLAGAAGTHARESERVILGRVDDWMTPSLVAG